MGRRLLTPGDDCPEAPVVLAARASLMRPPPCRLSSIAAMSWPLRILAVPVMPSDWATRWSSAAASPSAPCLASAPPAAAGAGLAGACGRVTASGQERTAPAGRGKSPPDRRHAGSLTSRLARLGGKVGRCPGLGGEQVHGFAHKGSFPGCGSRPQVRSPMPAVVLLPAIAACWRQNVCRHQHCQALPVAAGGPQESSLTRPSARTGQTRNPRDR